MSEKLGKPCFYFRPPLPGKLIAHSPRPRPPTQTNPHIPLTGTQQLPGHLLRLLHLLWQMLIRGRHHPGNSTEKKSSQEQLPGPGTSATSSPIMIRRRQVKQATRRGRPILLTDRTMGGGPSHWAVEQYLRAGYPVFATPDAARSFNDDLDLIREMGI